MFSLDTNASNEDIGGVLSQIKNPKVAVAAVFLMRAAVFFSRKFRAYLLGRQFTLRTDHQLLMWLLYFKDPMNQLAMWQKEI